MEEFYLDSVFEKRMIEEERMKKERVISRILSSVRPLSNISLFGLAPDGVYPASHVTMEAVSSYLAVSPLPGTWPGGLFSVALSPGHPGFALRTILPCGVRTFLSGQLTGAIMHPLQFRM